MSPASFVHPDYAYWSPQWDILRDCEIGEVEIKRRQTKYLPKLESQTTVQYSAYLSRAVFFNMFSRTLHALYGTVFIRNPKVTGMSDAMLKKAKNITKEGMSLHILAKTTVRELLAVGRYGMLVDASPDGGEPYITSYSAENIIDWEEKEVHGKWTLTKVIVREIFHERTSDFEPYTVRQRYRILKLTVDDAGKTVYQQQVFDEDTPTAGIGGVPKQVSQPPITPTIRGEVLNYIPFQFFGSFTNTPSVEKPPMLDIATLNVSHYNSYASIEHARFYVASPIYTVEGIPNGDNNSEYFVGPDILWTLPPNAKANILEFNGSGLKHLENALKSKEAQIAAIGGRLMPGASTGSAESDNSLMLKEQNENTLLLNISDTTDEGITNVIKWWLNWNNVSGTSRAGVTFELNRDFLVTQIGARELRAIYQMYEGGGIPVTVLYEYLRKADVVPDWMDRDAFVRLMNEKDEFPNMSDVWAQMKGHGDAKSFHEFKQAEKAMAQAATEVTSVPGQPAGGGIPQQASAAREVSESGDDAS